MEKEKKAFKKRKGVKRKKQEFKKIRGNEKKERILCGPIL